jgi:hypothetical protein
MPTNHRSNVRHATVSRAGLIATPATVAALLLILGLMATLALADAAPALATPTAHPVVADKGITGKKAITAGFYRGKRIGYFDFGPIKLRPGNKLAPIWAVTNGVSGQHNIVDTVPGQSDYSPLWQLNNVTFKPGATPHLLTSAAEVKQAEQRGEVTIDKTTTVINCPVLGFGQKRVAGFSGGKTIHYYDLGQVKLAAGNTVVPLYALTNGVTGQYNITGDTIAPGATDYPPLWGIVNVTWKPGAAKRLLTSFAAIKRAEEAGQLTLQRTSMVVNCPLVP